MESINFNGRSATTNLPERRHFPVASLARGQRINRRARNDRSTRLLLRSRPIRAMLR